MPSGLFRLTPGRGSRMSLSARGQRLNTFAGFGFSLAFLLLAMGAYVIAEQFADPLQAQSLNVPLAAVLIATALTLLYCLLRPSRKPRRGFTELPAPVYWEEKDEAAGSDPRTREPEQLTAAGRYVDRTRIHIRC
jgi:hypothetical protein